MRTTSSDAGHVNCANDHYALASLGGRSAIVLVAMEFPSRHGRLSLASNTYH